MADMIVCRQCGVELEPGMEVCPLCEIAVADGKPIPVKPSYRDFADDAANPKLLKRVLWQITCILLLSGTLATLLIDLSMVGHVTWSLYPVTICLILLSYAALMGLWGTKILIRIVAGWIVSSAVLILVHFFNGEDWPLRLALPLLSFINLISMALILIFKNLKVRGLNIVAISFLGAAVVCLMIEATVSQYFQNEVELSWSVVVSACLLPVTAVIIFMHFRTKNNSDLKKIFHT